MWARVHKIDRVKPQPGGGAIVQIEDERSVAAIGLFPSLSILIALARVIAARRMLETRYAGKGEVRYAARGMPPSPVLDALMHAGVSISDARDDRVLVPASRPGALSAIVDDAFAQLAHHVRTEVGAADMTKALHSVEATRRKTPLDREVNPAAYWRAVFELAALAGELSRPRSGRWVETTDLPVPFEIRFPDGSVARPARQAQDIVDGREATLVIP